MEDQEAKQELAKLKKVVPKHLNKIKCWICGQWQSENYTREVIFNGNPELVCIVCFNALEARDDALSMELPLNPDEEITPTGEDMDEQNNTEP